MVRYFEESLKLSIKAKMDQNNSQLIDYEELIAKMVRVEAKAGLHLRSYVRETSELSPKESNDSHHHAQSPNPGSG